LAWAFEGDADPDQIRSNAFIRQWPPNSGRQLEFPEVDRAKWFSLEEARIMGVKGQIGFLVERHTLLRACAPLLAD
jgi:predicted NUDIX family NTP pyrophosphohydrolase